MAIKMTEDLKGGLKWEPCPFCNGSDFILSEDEEGYYKEPIVPALYVACQNCHAEMWAYSHEIGATDEKEYSGLLRHLNKKWNRRVKHENDGGGVSGSDKEE